MSTIIIRYTCKYRLKFATNYIWDANGNCFNEKTNRKIKQVYNSGCIGYSIQGKFYSLTYLRTQLEKIPKDDCPF